MAYQPSTDAEYDLADLIVDHLNANPDKDYTPSRLARAIKTDAPHHLVQWTLFYLVREQYIKVTGNGAWSHYMARPFGHLNRV